MLWCDVVTGWLGILMSSSSTNKCVSGTAISFRPAAFTNDAGALNDFDFYLPFGARCTFNAGWTIMLFEAIETPS